MSKQRWVLTGAVGLGLLSAQACGNDTSWISSAGAGSPGSVIVLGGGGDLNRAGSGGQSAADPLAAGETNESAGQAGDGEAGSAGTAGSSDRDGAAGETSGSTGAEIGGTGGGANAGTGAEIGGTGGGANAGTGAETIGGTGGATSNGTAAATNGGTATGGANDESRGGTLGYAGGYVVVGDGFTVQATDIGDVLATASGLTLYAYGMHFHDNIGGLACSGPHLYFSTSLEPPPGLLASDFSIITCPNGAQQSAYKGWPLTTCDADQSVGDTKCESSNMPSVTEIVRLPFPPGGSYPAFTLDSGVLGNSQDQTLYVHTTDTPGTATSAPVSRCNGDCLTTWHPFAATSITVAVGLKVADFGTFDRGGNGVSSSDGIAYGGASGAGGGPTPQSTYLGWPLYTYAADSTTADGKGEGVDGVWHAAKVQ